MGNPLLQMAMAQQLRQPTTENIGTAENPIWKVSAEGEESPEQLIARWLMEMADTTGVQPLNQGDPDENYMSDLEDIFPEQPEPGQIAPNFNHRYPGDDNAE